MKLYSLRLRAIGPFPGEHSVDFEALGRSGLFLLEGPTGAGKSTLIDAVVFALYGQLAGHDSSKQRLASHHVDFGDGVEPYVELVFEVEAGLFRLRRTPAFERPKKRGTGTTTVNESVVLMRLNDVDRPDEGTVVSTRAQEVGDEIIGLVGLRRDQFLQTVVLPQGEFATFLRAAGEERKKLLQTIFRTDVYERLTRELVERRRTAQARTAEARRDVDAAAQVLARVADADQVDPERLLADARAEAERTAALVAESRRALEGAESDRRAAEALAAALARRAELIERRRLLEGSAERVEQAADRIARARRAAQVLPHLRAETTARQRHDQAAADQRSATEAVPDALDEAGCVERVDELTATLSDLGRLQVLETELADRSEELAMVSSRRLELEARLAELERHRAARPLQRADLSERRDRLVARLAERGAREAAVEAAERRVVAADRVAAATDEVAQARELVKTLAGDATTATHLVKDLQIARIRGMAGELAGALVVGESCMVCGSEAHPHPATRSADHPDAAAIETAERRSRELTASLAEAQTALEVATQQIEFWRQQADGASPDRARAGLDAARSALDELDQDAEAERELVAALERLDAEQTSDDAERGRIGADTAALRDRADRLAASITADRTRIVQVLDREDCASLEEIVRARQDERDAVRRLATALASVATAAARLVEAEHELATSLAAHELADRDAVRDALVPAAELERLEHEVEAHRGERARVDEGLSAPDVAALTGDEKVDVETARERRDVAADAHEAAVGLARVAARRLEQVVRAVTDLQAATAALDAADAESQAVTRLAGLADGTSPQNLKNLTLGTYVLLRRFADVVAAANRRLGPMSDGRYVLRVSDARERSSSGRRTGLALAVVDGETGREREPRTLSGGETFYVSLCLALGLADVVTAESGGVRLGTLFVDEGFGSLDPETLDAVMTQLSGLARGGRTVGLVSHVEELKQRVADRISVHRRRDGSSSLTVVA